MRMFRAFRNTFWSSGEWWVLEIKNQISLKHRNYDYRNRWDCFKKSMSSIRKRELYWTSVHCPPWRTQRRNSQECWREQENVEKPSDQWYQVLPDKPSEIEIVTGIQTKSKPVDQEPELLCVALSTKSVAFKLCSRVC